MHQVKAPGFGKRRGGFGAKATEEQGLEGIHAPSQSARIWKKAGGLGAKATEEQGLEGIHAPSPRSWRTKEAKGTVLCLQSPFIY